MFVSIPIHKQSWLYNIKIWNLIPLSESGTRLVSFPGFPAPEQEDVYMGRTCLVWPWHNQNRTEGFRTERQCITHCSTNYAFNTQCVWYSLETCSKWLVTFALFPVQSLQVCSCTIKISLPPLYPGCFSHDKNTRLSTLAQLQWSCSEAWEPGNEFGTTFFSLMQSTLESPLWTRM